MPLLIFFVVWGLLELFVLIKVAVALGALATIALLVLSAFAGGALIRHQRDNFARRITRTERKAALAQIREGAYRLLAGVLLILPGFVSDLFALCLLTPPLRRLFGSALLRIFKPDLVVRRFGWYDAPGAVYEHDGTVDAQRENGSIIEGTLIKRNASDKSH